MFWKCTKYTLGLHHESKTCYFSLAVLLQEYLVCLEREDVGFGLSEDNIKRFNVGEAVYGPGLLHGLVGNWLTIDKSQTF